MRPPRGVVPVMVVCALAGCGRSGSSPAPSAPSPISAVPGTPAVPVEVTGHVTDTALRALPGARIEVLDGPQTGASTTSDASGTFSLTGAFDAGTRLRAAKDGY